MCQELRPARCRRGPELLPSPANPSSLPVARPASDAVWFAPGADDLSRLPEKARVFEEVWDNLTSGRWPRGAEKRKPSSGGSQAHIDRALKAHREQEEILHEIRQQGFEWFGGEDEDGHFVPAFTEIGRRTALAGAHLIRRIVAYTERKPMSGTGKGAVTRQLRKEAALIDSYVVLSSRVRGVIRVDNEQVWKSWTDVYSWLRYLYAEGIIPCLPHLAVCKRSVDGQIRRPHFLILLPVGDEVRGDRRCKGGARGLMRAVENGWIRALGGDPGGASNARKIKSPTSPKNLVGIFNQQQFLTLGELAEVLDCRRLDDRRAAADQAGLDIKRSNSVFTEAQDTAWTMVPRMCDMKDPRYPRWVSDRATFRTELFGILIGPAVARHSGDKPVRAIEKIVMAVCAKIARYWDPTKVSRPPDRGVMGLPADMPLAGEDGKWVASGKWSSAKVLSKTLTAMATEIAIIEASGRPATEVDLVATKRWSKTTVYKRFDDAMWLRNSQSTPVAGKKRTTPSIKSAIDPENIPTAHCFEPEMIVSPLIEPD